jgi:predicted secreted acid phosphatase
LEDNFMHKRERAAGGISSILALVIFAALSSASTSALAAWTCATKDTHTLEKTQPLNIGQLKFQLRDYRYCGEYDRDFAAKIAEARAYLEAHARVERAALVLDIDETSLSNWLEIDQDDFAFIPGGPCTLQPGAACGDQQWELSARAEALKPTLDLFNTAKALGVTVFFITGRQDRFDLRDATVTNLKRAGYDGWQELVMRPIASAGSVSDYKSSARKAIMDRGYRIIVNVGDQQSDLEGGNADQAFRLPNPFYFSP